MIILGDLNINYLKPSNHFNVKTLLTIWGLEQLIKQATRITTDTSTLIDVILTNRQNNISSSHVIPISFSDHDLIACIRKLNSQKYSPKHRNCKNFKHYTKERFCELMSGCNWNLIFDSINVNDAWNNMKDIIKSCLDQIAPIENKRIRGKPCPWMTQELKQKMDERDILLRKSRKTKNSLHINAYKRKKNFVNQLVKRAKQNYFKNLLNNSANDPDRFWSTLKKLYPTKSKKGTDRFTLNGESISNSKTISNAFCSYFSNVVSHLKAKSFTLRNCTWIRQLAEPLRTCHRFKFGLITEESVYKELRNLKSKKSAGLDEIPPSVLKDAANILSDPLCHIINMSFTNGIFPTDWKRSKLIPTYKSGKKYCIENYRPISVIPAISKVIEKLVHHQL